MSNNLDPFEALKALDAMPAKKPEAPKPQPKPKPEQKDEPRHEQPKAAPKTEKKTKTGKKPREKKEGSGNGPKIGRIIESGLRGDLLGSEWVKRQVWLLLLIGSFCIAMIWMRYQVESLQKDKIATTERINFLREHQIQMQKQYQETVKISYIASALDSIKVGTVSGPPYEI